jgi:tRNA dimethylallyltransferase
MGIGTAQPTLDEQARVRHHLIDILNPDDELSLAQYQALSFDAIRDVTSRGRLPLLVGGTGQYVRAVVEGWSIPEIAPDYTVRLDLEAFAGVYSPTVLHDRLARVDPVAASAIDYRNIRRVVRALEVYHLARQPISMLQQRHPPPYHFLMLGLTRSRGELFRRIDRRIDQMIEEGLIAEVQRLMAMGYGAEHPAMSSLGYRK